MRPPQYITPEELSLFQKKNKAFRMAWEDMAPIMKMRDLRGIKKWVFALGWIACAYHYRFYLSEQAEKTSAILAKEAEKQLTQWETKTGLNLFI